MKDTNFDLLTTTNLLRVYLLFNYPCTCNTTFNALFNNTWTSIAIVLAHLSRGWARCIWTTSTSNKRDWIGSSIYTTGSLIVAINDSVDIPFVHLYYGGASSSSFLKSKANLWRLKPLPKPKGRVRSRLTSSFIISSFASGMFHQTWRRQKGR